MASTGENNSHALFTFERANDDVPRELEKIPHGQPSALINTKTSVLYSWLAEIFAVIFSAFCLLALAITVGTFDGRPQPSPWHGLSLNTIVSILSTASKSSLIFAVTSAIGQLKWTWFRLKQPLIDIQTIDSASRGPLGSVALLSARRMPLVSFGALVTFVAIAFDPFAQQVLRYSNRLVSSPDPTELATTLRGSAFRISESSPALANARMAGIWNIAGEFARQATCPSGNCHWPAYQSLEWCSKCSNVTAAASTQLAACKAGARSAVAQNSTIRCDITFDNGANLSLVSSHMVQNGSFYKDTRVAVWDLHRQGPHSCPGDKTTFLDIRNPFVALAYFQMDGTFFSFLDPESPWFPHRAYAEECVLTPCLRDYEVNVKDGKPDFKITHTNYGIMDPGQCRWRSHSGDIPVVPDSYDVFFAATQHAGVYSIRRLDLLADVLVPFLTHRGKQQFGDYGDGDFSDLASPAYSYTPGGGDVSIIPQVQARGLSRVMSDLAASLTTLTVGLSGESVKGYVAQSKVFVHIEWRWLTVPLLVEAGGVIFLLWVIVLTSRREVPVWKASLLPFLHCASDAHVLGVDGVWADISTLKATARITEATINTIRKDSDTIG